MYTFCVAAGRRNGSFLVLQVPSFFLTISRRLIHPHVHTHAIYSTVVETVLCALKQTNHPEGDLKSAICFLLPTVSTV